MKAYNILEQAAALIGSPIDEPMKKAGVGLVNTILQDIGLPTISSLTEEIADKEGAFTVASNGVAMLLSLYLGDDAGTEQLNEVYGGLRRRMLGGSTKVQNTLFRGEAN